MIWYPSAADDTNCSFTLDVLLISSVSHYEQRRSSWWEGKYCLLTTLNRADYKYRQRNKRLPNFLNSVLFSFHIVSGYLLIHLENQKVKVVSLSLVSLKCCFHNVAQMHIYYFHTFLKILLCIIATLHKTLVAELCKNELTLTTCALLQSK